MSALNLKYSHAQYDREVCINELHKIQTNKQENSKNNKIIINLCGNKRSLLFLSMRIKEF